MNNLGQSFNRSKVERLEGTRNLKIAPSILAADFGRLAEEAKAAEQGGGDYLHIDIMDGHFVPNITFGPEMVAMLRKNTTLPLDVHLMISQPDRHARAFIEAGADILTVHLEASHNVGKTLKMIRDMGCKCGLAINPPTLASAAIPYLNDIDLMLCMTVNPGFGGQPFIHDVLEKVKTFRSVIEQEMIPVELEVDGGVNAETIAACSAAGSNVFVAGTAVFKKRVPEAISDLRDKATKARTT